jgi:hypothetical protein
MITVCSGAGVFLLCLALFCFGAIQSGTPCGFMDVAPNHSSEINTVANCFASCAGFICPVMVASFQASSPGQSGWQAAFGASFAVCATAVAVWYKYEVTTIIPSLNTKPT